MFSCYVLVMRYKSYCIQIIVAVLLILPSINLADELGSEFRIWLEQLRSEALNKGISKRTLELVYADIEAPLTKVIDNDRSQPEFSQTFNKYLTNRINKQFIKTGKKMLGRYPTWLSKVERKYSVQKRFLVALWGIESSYGKYLGTYPVIQALATLAYDQRRSKYFRQELFEALHLIDDGIIPYERMQGSWAGAMGQCQFMPSSFRRYAVDADNSGSINIWASVPDVLGSIGNYLAQSGWKNDQTWGREIKLPKGFDYSLAGLEKRRPLSEWQSMGVRRINNRDLPTRNLMASLVLPEGPTGPSYLVYDNFRVLLSWNRSTFFALTVGILSDQFK